MKILLLLLCTTVITGCSLDPQELNGALVKDMNDKVYRVKAGAGEVYFLTLVHKRRAQQDAAFIADTEETK